LREGAGIQPKTKPQCKGKGKGARLKSVTQIRNVTAREGHPDFNDRFKKTV